MISIQKILFIIGFSLISIPACDVRKIYSPVLLIWGVSLLIGTSLFTGFKNYSLKLTKNETIVWGMWMVLIISLFPSYIGGNITVTIVIEKIIIFVLYFIILSKSNLNVFDLFSAAIVINLYMAYRCFFEIGTTNIYYQGTMINPNQMALVLVGGAIGSLYLIVSSKWILKIVGLFSFTITVILLFYTSSRTIMLTVGIAFMAYIIYYIAILQKTDFLKTRKISKKLFLFLCIFISIFVILLLYFHSDIIDFLFNKWGNSGNRLLSGRTDIWKKVFADASFIGNYKSSINTNNDFLDWLLKYGIFSFIAYITLIVTIIVISVKRFLDNKTNDNFWILVIIFCYVFICMFENVHAIFGKPINILFWSAAGFVARSNSSR